MKAIHRGRWLNPCVALVGVVITLAAIAWPVFGEGEPPHIPVEIDVFGLLKSKDVTEPEAQDSIWSIKAAPGRRLFQLPLSVSPSDSPIVLDQQTIKIRGARFLVFRMTDEIEGAPKGSEAARQIEASLPDGPPLIARKLTIEPSGKVRWSMDRSLVGFGGTVKTTTRLYAFKLDPKLLEHQAPVPPKRLVTAGETAGAREAEEARFAEEEAQYRSNAVDYRQLMKQVRALPDSFEADLPPRIWAVFELFTPGQLDITGPPPLPWTISFNQIDQLRHATEHVQVEHVGDSTRLSKDGQGRIAFMTGLMIKPQAYTSRAIAYALAESEMVSYAQPGDSLYRLMESVIHSHDIPARRLIIRELARTVPPTSASMALLKASASDMDPGTQMLSLQTMLKIDIKSNPGQVREAITEANHLVSDASGPPPKEVIQTLLDAAEKERDTMSALASGVDFDTASAGRRDGLIAAIIEKAPTAPLAASWLDRKLLGSTDAGVVRRTLEVLAAAEVEGSASQNVIAPVTGELMRLVFGQAQTQPAASDNGVPKLKLSQPIPIESTSHSLFRVLQSTNTEVRSLAWAALPRFVAVGEPASSTSQGVPSSEICQQLLSIGLSQSPTPPQLIEMLAQQKDTETVANAMVRLVVRGTSEASHQASMAILACRSAWPIGKALAASLDDRQEFATRTYENISGKTPAVTGLLRQRIETSPVVDWFADQLTAGKLPSPSDWLEHAGGEEKVLEMVVSSDPELARGAVAALVASVGGDDRLVPGLTQKFSELPDTRLANLQTQWNESRRDIFAARLQRAAGSYRLVLIIAGTANTTTPLRPAGPPGPGPGAVDPRSAANMMRPITAAPAPGVPGGTAAGTDSKSTSAADAHPAASTTIAMGVVQLQADGQSIRLANQALTLSIPANRLAIRVEKIGELKNFGNEQASKLPLEQVTTPVDLLPQSNNVWSGKFELSDGRKAEIQLQPAE